jgi:hypothetical protein
MTSNLTNIANYAAESIGVNDSGETLSTQQLSDMLDLTNKILDSWSTQQIQIPNVVTNAFALSASTGSYIVGTGGPWVTSPPVRIAEATLIMANSVVTPIKVVSAAEWADLPDRAAISDWVRFLYYAPPAPIGTTGIAYVSPTPKAGGSVEAKYWQPLTQFADTTTVIAFFPGYLIALQWTLAKRMCSYFDVPWSQDNEADLETAMNAVRSLNAELWGLIAQGSPVAAAPAQ